MDFMLIVNSDRRGRDRKQGSVECRSLDLGLGERGEKREEEEEREQLAVVWPYGTSLITRATVKVRLRQQFQVPLPR